MLASSNFFAILSDGSQARKTGYDKELVMIRTERNGKISLHIIYFIWKELLGKIYMKNACVRVHVIKESCKHTYEFKQILLICL